VRYAAQAAAGATQDHHRRRRGAGARVDRCRSVGGRLLHCQLAIELDPRIMVELQAPHVRQAKVSISCSSARDDDLSHAV